MTNLYFYHKAWSQFNPPKTSFEGSHQNVMLGEKNQIFDIFEIQK